MTERHTYRWGTLAVHSPITLSSLDPSSSGANEVTLDFCPQSYAGEYPVEVTDVLERGTGRVVMRLGGDEDRFVYDVHGTGTYVLEPETIHIHPHPDAAPGQIEHYLVHGVLATHTGLRGRLCLHAASVALPEGAVILAGPSRAGKSTRARALLEQGGRLLSDDHTELSGPDPWLAYPGPRTLRIGGPGRSDQKSVRLVAGSTEPTPLRRLVVLARAVTVPAGAELVASLLSLQGGWPWIGPERRRVLTRLIGRLLEDVAVHPEPGGPADGTADFEARTGGPEGSVGGD